MRVQCFSTGYFVGVDERNMLWKFLLGLLTLAFWLPKLPFAEYPAPYEACQAAAVMQ